VLFSDTRNRSQESPYYADAGNVFPQGNSIQLATPNPIPRASLPHNQGGQITFSDGHAAYYKYGYVVSDGTSYLSQWPLRRTTVPRGKDPAGPDINWDCRGFTVHPVGKLISVIYPLF